MNLAPALRERVRFVLLLVGKGDATSDAATATKLGVCSGLFAGCRCQMNGRGFVEYIGFIGQGFSLPLSCGTDLQIPALMPKSPYQIGGDASGGVSFAGPLHSAQGGLPCWRTRPRRSDAGRA